MKIKALVPFSNGTISMEQYEVREVTDSLGNELISAGIAVEIGGGGLPPVTASDSGKVLAVDNSGVWVAQEPIGKKFIVTLTPTAQDYSGTMDKTVAEIDAAYKAGQEIWFKVMTSATASMMSKLQEVYDNGSTYPSYNAVVIESTNNVLIRAETLATDNGTKATYSTSVYTLTPAT